MTEILLFGMIGTMLVVLAFRYWVLSYHRPPKTDQELRDVAYIRDAVEFSELDINEFPVEHPEDWRELA